MNIANIPAKTVDGMQLFIRDQLIRIDMEPLYARVRDDWDAYLLEPPGYNSFPMCSNVRSDVVRNAVDAKVTMLENGVFRRPNKFKVTPRSVNDEDEFRSTDAAQVLTKAWDYLFDHETELTKTLTRDSKVLCVQGYVVFKVRRKKCMEPRVISPPEKKTPEIEPIEIKDYACCNMVHYNNFICDPEYKSIENAPLITEVFQASGTQLKFWSQQPGWNKEKVREVLDHEEGRWSIAEYTENLTGIRTGGEDNQYPIDRPRENPLVTLYEFYCEAPPEFTGFKNPIRMYGIFHTGTDNILFINYLQYLDLENRYPYEVPVLYEAAELGGRWWGYGVPRWFKSLSDVVDDSLNRARDDALIFGRPPMVTSEADPEIRNTNIVINPWGRIRVQSPNSIKFLELPPMSHQYHLEQLQIFQQRYERATNVFPETLGDVSSLKTHQTASSVASVMNQGSTSHFVDAMRMVENYQRLLRRLAAIRSTIMIERIVDVQTIGPETNEPLLQVLTLEELAMFVKLSQPGEILNEFRWEFDVTGLKTQQSIQALLAAIQMLQQTPMAQTFPEKIHNMVIDVLSMMEVPNAASLRVTQEEAQQRQATVQAQALMQATGKQKDQFFEDMSPEVVQQFMAMAQQAAGGGQQGAMGP